MKMDDDGDATPMPTTMNGEEGAAHQYVPLLHCSPLPSLTSHHSLLLPYFSPLPPPPLLLTTPSPSVILTTPSPLFPPLLFTTLPPLSLISYHFPPFNVINYMYV